MQQNRIFTNITYQPKYNPKNVTNETFNELAEKLTRNQGFLNKMRMEKRLKNFLNILDYKLKQDNIDPNTFKKLYDYFNKICEKYKDELSTILSSNPTVINQIKKKLEIYNANKFIDGYLGNPNRNVNLEKLQFYLSSIINLAKEEKDFTKFNQLKEKYYILLSLYKQIFYKNNSNIFLNTSIKSFEQLEQNKFPSIFQPSQ